MRFFRGSHWLLLIFLLSCFNVAAHAQNQGMLGQSITWRAVNAPFTPGLQPGWLEDGKCHIPYNVDLVYNPPFEALYNVFGPSGANGAQNQSGGAGTPVQQSGPGAQPHGILLSFGSGTGATAGTVTVTNGLTGTTVTKPLPPNSSPQPCMGIVQQAAFEAGLQIQADGSGLRVFGTNNAINVTQASVSVSQF